MPRRIKRAYYQPKAGEWIRPVSKGYRLACCDCGLVHLVNFRIRKNRPEFSVYRGERHTAAMRRRAHRFVPEDVLEAVSAKLLKVTGKKSVRCGKYVVRLKK